MTGPELSRRLADLFSTGRLTLDEKSRIVAAAEQCDTYDHLPPEIRALIARVER